MMNECLILIDLTNQNMKNQVLCILLSFIIMGQSSFIKGKPDAIRCGDGPNAGAIYIAHGVAQSVGYYCQVYAGEDRCVIFNGDGSYKSGRGHYQSRKGCENKSLSQLKAQNRTFQLTQQTWVLQKFAQLERQNADNAKLTAEKINSLQKNQKEQEAKIKTQDEMIQILEFQVQTLKQNSKKTQEENDKKVLQLQKRIQNLQQQVRDSKKQTNQTYLKLELKMTNTIQYVLKTVNQIQSKLKSLIKLKIQEIQLQLATNNNQIVLLRVASVQKQLKNITNQLLQDILSLKNQIDDHACSRKDKQHQLSEQVSAERNDEQISETAVKSKNNLKQDIQISGEKSSQAKPKQ